MHCSIGDSVRKLSAGSSATSDPARSLLYPSPPDSPSSLLLALSTSSPAYPLTLPLSHTPDLNGTALIQPSVLRNSLDLPLCCLLEGAHTSLTRQTLFPTNPHAYVFMIEPLYPSLLAVTRDMHPVAMAFWLGSRIRKAPTREGSTEGKRSHLAYP